MPYELIELTTANIVGVYASEDEALRDVAEAVRLYGPDAVATLALGLDDYPNSPGRAIADGPELAALACRLTSEMPSSLATLLEDALPKLRRETGCWVGKAIALDREPGLIPLRNAIDVVAESEGQVEILKVRIRNEHPVSRVHRREYDDGVLDVMTEACAFAWAARRRLGAPRFTSTTEGAPDIQVNESLWIEAKAVHASDADRQVTEQMVRSRVLVAGEVRLPGPGFTKKFEDHYQNAVKKFERQGASEGIVFFNLTALDLGSLPTRETTVQGLREWAGGKERTNPKVSIVLIVGYEWSAPRRDPFADVSGPGARPLAPEAAWRRRLP